MLLGKDIVITPALLFFAVLKHEMVCERLLMKHTKTLCHIRWLKLVRDLLSLC